MNSPQRRHFSAQEKVAILRKHFLEKVPVSDLCDQYGIQANSFYNWQKIFFENGAAAFEANGRSAKRSETIHEQKIAGLEAKLQRKDSVLAELMEEHTLLKKVLGNPKRRLDAPRHPRSDRRFRQPLARPNRTAAKTFRELAGPRLQQVPQLET